jgi:hypothetical protein
VRSARTSFEKEDISVGMGIRSRTGREKRGAGLFVCISVLPLLVLLLVLLSCEAKDDGPTGPGTLPTDDPIVDRGAGTLLADGEDTKEIFAYVFSEQGEPLQGIVVRFTTTVGLIEPSAVTNFDGVASATLTSVYSSIDRTAQICATIPENADSSALPGYKTGPVASREAWESARLVRLEASDEGGESPGKTVAGEAALAVASRSACTTQSMLGVSVAMGVNPARIPADGVSRAAVRVTVTETTSGVPVVGFPLVFGTNAGTVQANKETDSEGIASVSLTSSTTPYIAEVDVYAGGDLAAQSEVRFTPIRMNLSANPASVNADGESASEIAALLLSEESAPLRGLPIVFETDEGTVSSPETTGTDGRAVATLTSASAAGAARVIARFAGALAESIDVVFTTSFRPAEIILSADPAEIVADGVSRSSLRAVVLDSTGVAVPDGTPIRFEVLSGGGTVTGVATTESGTATMPLTSPTRTALASVRAYSGDLADTVSVRYAPGAPARIGLAADPDTLVASGVDVTRITAVVEDKHGNRVDSGVRIDFEATRGEVEPSALTDQLGTAMVDYVSPVGAGEVRITATAGGSVSAQIALYLLSGPPGSILLDSLEHPEIDVQGTGDPEASRMVFRVLDCYGVPIGADRPTIVSFELVATTDGGGEYLCCLLDTTDRWGRVQTSLHSGTLPGVTETIARVVGSVPSIESQAVPVTIHRFLPHVDHLDVRAARCNLDGLCANDLWGDSITAYVYDEFGNAVTRGTAVYFRTDYSGITGADTSDGDGRAHAFFYQIEPLPPTGHVTIYAQTADSFGNPIEDTTTILLSGCTAPITASPMSFAIANGGSQYFTYHVSDALGHPLTEGTAITVEATAGTVVGNVEVELPDACGGYTDFAFYLLDDNPTDTDPPAAVFITIEVKSRNGDRQLIISGTLD